MSRVIESIERRQMRPNIPQFKAGDTVRVHFQVIEGQRRRTQVFEGIVIKRQGSGVHETFTVRKQSFGVGVERTFPIHSPKIERIELAAIGVVRRAKLYYLRDKVGKRARVRTKAGAIIAPTPVAAPAEPQPEPVEAAESDELAVGHEEAGVAGEATSETDVAGDSDAAGASPPGDASAPENDRE